MTEPTVITKHMWNAWQNDAVTRELVQILKEEAAARARSLIDPAMLDDPKRFTVAGFIQMAEWLAEYIEDGHIAEQQQQPETEANVRSDFDTYLRRRLGI